MEQQKLTGYEPNYPKKILRGAAIAAAALLAAGATTGCTIKFWEELVLDGETRIFEPTPEPQIEGYIMPEGELVTVGIVPTEEPTEDTGELTLSGDVQIDDGE